MSILSENSGVGGALLLALIEGCREILLFLKKKKQKDFA
jgi:hypothetical protein